MNIGIPLYLLNVVVNWHLKLKGQVKWNGEMSAIFTPKSGVRQSGINSTWLFNVYIFDLITRLRESGFGCYIGSLFLGYLFFANDILLVFTSIVHLQNMLHICSIFGIEYDIKFNAAKSQLLQIGQHISVVLPDLMLSNVPIKWCSQIKYPRMYINAGKKFDISSDVSRRKFLGSVFAIL